MIPVWRYQGTRLVPCAQCRVQVETSNLARGEVYYADCRLKRRQGSRERANRKARMRRGQDSLCGSIAGSEIDRG